MNAAMKSAPTQTAEASRKLAAGIVSVGKSYNADPKRITFTEGWNNRFDMGDIAALAEGIRATARLHPDRPFQDSIGVRRIPKSDPRSATHDFVVEYGHRRTLAAHLLIEQGFEFPQGVNVNLIDKDQSRRVSRIGMFNENNKKPLLPLEEAIAYKDLRETKDEEFPNGMSISDICKAVGRTDVHVRETLALLEADQEVQDAVANGEVAGSTAKLIVSVAKGDKAAEKELITIAKRAKTKGADGKKAKSELLTKVEQQRAKNAEAANREMKVNPLKAVQLDELGQQVAKHLAAVLKEANLSKYLEDPAAYRDLISKDEALAAAFTFGALQGVIAAAGQKIDLMI